MSWNSTNITGQFWRVQPLASGRRLTLAGKSANSTCRMKLVAVYFQRVAMPTRKLVRYLQIVCCIGMLSGCLAEDPSSFRNVDGLLPGLWTQVDDPPDPPTVHFLPDGTFTSTSSGVPGSFQPNFHGGYWQAENVIAFRGTGFVDTGTGDVEGVRVQFIQFRITEDPLGMTMTVIDKAYVEELVGVEDVHNLSSSGVQSALRRMVGFPLPETALGFTFDYLK